MNLRLKQAFVVLWITRECRKRPPACALLSLALLSSGLRGLLAWPHQRSRRREKINSIISLRESNMEPRLGDAVTIQVRKNNCSGMGHIDWRRTRTETFWLARRAQFIAARRLASSPRTFLPW